MKPRARAELAFATLLLIAAFRLWLQMAALPPYAGLDEVFHVARLAFVAAEHRNPSMKEASVAPYLARSIAGQNDALPAFGVVGAQWPELVRRRAVLVEDHCLTATDLRPYLTANYEAQQPSLYYSFLSGLPRVLRCHTPLTELRLWRVASWSFALLTVMVTAYIGFLLYGTPGILAGAALLSIPTWHTLVIRAGNDSLACASLALALAGTLSRPQKPAGWMLEALLWMLAVSVKLYTWPAAIAVPFLWRLQKASWRRVMIVLASSSAAALATMLEMHRRTENALGLFAFDHAIKGVGTLRRVDVAGMIRVTLATAAWTSGQHLNALRPFAMALYLVPILACVLWATLKDGPESIPLLRTCASVAVTFGVAQCVDAWGYIRQSASRGMILPAGGKEGWYWFALAPLFAGVLLGYTFRHAGRWLSMGLVAWFVAWDVLITEGALFQDFAGRTSAGVGDVFFRWGPRSASFRYAELRTVSAGPGVRYLAILRGSELVLLVILVYLTLPLAAAQLSAVREKHPQQTDSP